MTFKIMTYENKLEVANKYLGQKVGLSWDDFPDINSLHDVCDVDDIIDLCDERIREVNTGDNWWC